MVNIMIKGLEIRNFRGIKQVVLDELKQVTILLGRNGAGKSTILEAIYAASAWVNDKDIICDVNKLDYITCRRGNRGDWKTFREALWFSMNPSREVTIWLSLVNGGELEFTLTHDNPEPRTWLKVTRDLHCKIASSTLNTDYILLDISHRQLKNLLLNIREDIKDEDLTRYPHYYHKAFKLLRNVLFIDQRLLSTPSIVLIEDPENHQHTTGMKALMNFILRLAKEKKFQLLITTHSIELTNITTKSAQILGLETTTLLIE